MSLSETYDRVSDLQFESGKKLALELGLEKGARVLDVGCGTGRLTNWIAEHGCRVIGIDPIEERIHVARSHGGSARFEIGQAEDLRAFEDASFDAVCMSSVLHWVADKPKALAEARRVLKPGARLGVTTLAREFSSAGTVGQLLDSVLGGERVRGLTTTELVTLVLESGLDLDDLHITTHAQTFANAEAVVDFMEASAFGTLLRTISEERRAKARADLVAAADGRKTSAGIEVRGWVVRFIASRGSRTTDA